MLYKDMDNTTIRRIDYDSCPNPCADCKDNCERTAVGRCREHLADTCVEYAYVDRCQSVRICGKLFVYGESIPKIKWLLDDDGTYNEIYDAKILAVSEDWVQFDGEDHNGNPVTVTIDVDDVIP